MVKKIFFCLCIFAMPLLGYGDLFVDPANLSEKVTLKVEVQDELAVEEKAFISKLIIHHPDNEKVDESSFKMDGKTVPMQLLNQGRQSSVSIINGKKMESSHTISCYIFEMKGSKKGAHQLPPIEVMVGGKLYQTEPVNYLVNGTERSHHFNLDAFIDAPKPLYPGQKINVTYRITMSEPVEIFYDNLPLLDLKDFQKSGKRKSRVFYQGNKRVEEYSQAYVVESPGEIQIEPSFLEGRAYSEDFFGRRRYKKEMLRAESTKEEIKIEDFPKEGRPSSFNGAIGNFSMKASLDSSNQVCVGDKLKLNITFKGKGELSSVKLPNLSTQDEFKEDFRFNDMPLCAKKQDQEKTFVCELRPMREDITEIPPFAFSYYDPQRKSYVELKSDPIAITLLPMKPISEETIVAASMDTQKEIESEINSALESPEFEKPTTPSLIEIHSVYPLSDQMVHKQDRRYYLTYWAIAFLGIILTQVFLKYFLFTKKQKRNSAFYFQKALKHEGPLQNYPLLLEKALLLKLKEQKFIKENVSIEGLGQAGLVGEVREFMEEVTTDLFSGQKSFNLEKSQSKAKALYKKIGENF